MSQNNTNQMKYRKINTNVNNILWNGFSRWVESNNMVQSWQKNAMQAIVELNKLILSDQINIIQVYQKGKSQQFSTKGYFLFNINIISRAVLFEKGPQKLPCNLCWNAKNFINLIILIRKVHYYEENICNYRLNIRK